MASGRILAAALLLLSGPAWPQEVLVQGPAVMARFPDLPVALGSPYFQPGAAPGFTTQARVEAFARDLGVPRLSFGTTGQGRDLIGLLFGAPDLTAAAARQKPMLLVIGQQHGNEPAGGEAALALAARLAPSGDLAALTRDVTVLILPRANPDGAAAFTRDTAAGDDMNRDHLLLTTPEARAIAAAARALPPDVVLDLHEFSVGGRWPQKFGGLQASDVMLLRATHPLVPPEATRLADTLFLPAIEAAVNAAGATTQVYVTTSARADDLMVSTGGSAAGLGRNAFGLMGAVSILLETRGVGIGEQSFQRRVATHVVAAEAALRAMAAHGALVSADLAAGRAAAAAARGDLPVAFRVPVAPAMLPVMDATTGVVRQMEMALQDSRRIEVTLAAPRPAGYLLVGDAAGLAADLRLGGLVACAAPAGAPLRGEAFALTATATLNRRAINQDAIPALAVTASPGSVPAAAVFVPLAQPGAGRAVAALDPASPGGLVAAGLISAAADGALPVWRVAAGFAGCGG